MKTVRSDLLPVANVYIDQEIYPRVETNDVLVARYAECLQEGMELPPIRVEQVEPDRYRVLDGVHRYEAHKKAGNQEIQAEIVCLEGKDPLLYAALLNRHGKALGDEDARSVARRAYERNPNLSTKEIALAVGRSERMVSSYIRDLRARHEFQRDLTIFKLHLLGWQQEQIANAVGLARPTISQKLGVENGNISENNRQNFPSIILT